MSSKNVIRLRGVAVHQGGDAVLTDINLDVEAGEFIYFIGRVGSGKTSLMKLLYGEIPLLAGEAHVAGFDLSRLRKRDITALRRQLGVVFQDYQLLPDRNIFMNLYFVMRATGWTNEEEIRVRIDDVLHLTGLVDQHYKMPHELSGGEQQRVVIARALLNKPRLLLADEPTGNLDPSAADGIMRLFKRIAREGTAVIMSTHNTVLVEEHPARTVWFADNRIKEL